MATIKRTINWISSTGAKVEITIERTKEVQDDIAYADGYNIKVGVKTYDSTEIAVSIDGKSVARSSYAPSPITKLLTMDYDKLTAQGVYAKIERVYIKQDLYDVIMAALAEIETELADADYDAVKSAEIAKQTKIDDAYRESAKRHAEDIKNGMCPKCGSWCYGDCGR
jgi:hypothetical protein